MRGRTGILGFLMAAAVMAGDAPKATVVPETPDEALVLPEQVTSSSGQFRISGGDSLLRGTVAVIAENTKADLHGLTAEDPSWKLPILVNLLGRAGDPLPPRSVTLRLLVIEGAAQLVIDAHLSRGLDHERLRRSLLSAMLVERALGEASPQDPDTAFVVPPWLVEGLMEAISWKRNQSDRRLYETLFESGGLYRLETLLETNERGHDRMDGASRAAFRVSSGSLVMALLEQPQGKDGFRAFLTEAAGFAGEMPALLRKHFPELNLSENSLAKWWSLQLAIKGARNLATEVLSIRETEDSLARVLRLNFRTPDGLVQEKELGAWPELAALAEAERLLAVRKAEDALVRLSYRCFPSYRPLLVEYQGILTDIAKQDTAEVPQRLVALEETRVTMLGRASQARDFMDWFEITRARETSGAFNDYLRLKERLKLQPRNRRDPVSRYLDKMDKLFHRPEFEEDRQRLGP